MIAVVQRVSQASVTVDNQVVGKITRGLLVLAAVEKNDTAADINWTAAKLAGLRIFPAGERNFDRDVKQINGSILLVSNFTVAANTRYGRRASLDGAADPQLGRKLFDDLVVAVRAQGVIVETGRFGAEMRVSLVNDGPATFLIDSAKTERMVEEKT